jgi:hypothetical protein
VRGRELPARSRTLRRRFNSLLDGAARRQTVVAGRTLDMYMLWVYGGVVAGTAVIFALSARSSVSLPVLALLVAIVAVLSFTLFKSTKVVGRSHPLLNWAKRGVYHFQIAAVAVTVLVLELLREPVLPYLDILVVGMLVYQAFGRIGCFMAGCCHGRPSSWGVRYGKKHAEAGYVYFVQGTRLFPVQLLESLWLFFLTAGAIAISLEGGRAGENVAWYAVGYASGRFVFELLRGDTGRIVVRGLSEPQWTALLASSVVVALELGGVLPFHRWHVAAVVALASATVALLVRREVRGSPATMPLEHVRRTEDEVLSDAGLVRVTRRRGRDISGVYVPAKRR